MKQNKVTFLVYIWALVVSGSGYGQTSSLEKAHYNWFDTTTGMETSNLMEGTLVVEKYATLDGYHKFYTSNDYVNGHIVFDGETYFDVDLKYDLYEDELLLPLRSTSKALMLKLVKERVGQFEIDGRIFVRLGPWEDNKDEVSGFFEVLAKTAFFTLLKKHKKEGYTNFKRNMVLYKFVKKDQYYIEKGGKLYKVKNKRDIIKIFPESKTHLNQLPLEPLRKSNMDAYLVKLMDVVHQNWLPLKSPVIE